MSRYLILLVAFCIMSTTISAQKLKNGCNGKCNDGFFLNDTLSQCLACPANCQVCNDSNTCTECIQGSFLNDMNNCADCGVSGCLNCNKHGECDKCFPGYFLSANSSTCSYCGYPCDECASETTCASCPKDNVWMGSYLLNGTCAYCPDGCLGCDSAKTCTTCRDGYVLSGSKCVLCSGIDAECTACDAALTQCSGCQDGFYLLNNTCLQCLSGCKSCSDEGSCGTCQDGFFLNTNKGCTPCISNCKQCSNATSCDVCQDFSDYIPETQECLSCNNWPWNHPTPLHIFHGPGPVIMPLDTPVAMPMPISLPATESENITA